jgi:conjugative transfer signal peptidase TraF
MTRRILVATTLVAVLLGSLPALQGFGVRVNLTPSEPRGLYLLTQKPWQRGRLVIFRLTPSLEATALDAGYALPGEHVGATMPGLKRIAALPGDVVKVGAQGIGVNGVLWPDSKPLTHDSYGRQIRHYDFGVYRVRPNEIWVLSDNPRGWDSRYFGPVPMASVVATAQPLFTVE